ncbi:MAG: carbon storage regulator CsrA [Phycisphaerales bacterium]
MLVLSRQRDETIMIGDEIEISVVDIRGDKVRLGINAPTRIAVHRKEVYDAIRRENTQAARLGATDLDSLAQTIKPGPARREIRAGTSAPNRNAGTALGATTVKPCADPHSISVSPSRDKDTA